MVFELELLSVEDLNQQLMMEFEFVWLLVSKYL